VILGLVAIDTLEIITTHVNINTLGREIQAFIKVAVLHGVTATTAEVTTATVLAVWNTNAFCRLEQVDPFQRQTGFTLSVGTRVIVAHQAVNVGLVAEIKICIIPAVTSVARRAGRPVALDADAEIIDGFFLARGMKTLGPVVNSPRPSNKFL
jgi:hypothetical protein